MISLDHLVYYFNTEMSLPVNHHEVSLDNPEHCQIVLLGLSGKQDAVACANPNAVFRPQWHCFQMVFTLCFRMFSLSVAVSLFPVGLLPTRTFISAFSLFAFVSDMNGTCEAPQIELLIWKLKVGVTCFGVILGILCLGWALPGTGKFRRTSIHLKKKS